MSSSFGPQSVAHIRTSHVAENLWNKSDPRNNIVLFMIKNPDDFVRDQSQFMALMI